MLYHAPCKIYALNYRYTVVDRGLQIPRTLIQPSNVGYPSTRSRSLDCPNHRRPQNQNYRRGRPLGAFNPANEYSSRKGISYFFKISSILISPRELLIQPHPNLLNISNVMEYPFQGVFQMYFFLSYNIGLYLKHFLVQPIGQLLLLS